MVGSSFGKTRLKMPDMEKSAGFEIRAGEVDLAVEVMQEVARWCIESGNPIGKNSCATRRLRTVSSLRGPGARRRLP